MRVCTLDEIKRALHEEDALAAVVDAFRRLAKGEAQVAAVGHLAFADPPGDCHVKGGHLAGDDVFVVKIATSFYRNPDLGLSSSDGCMLVISARTGEKLALLDDKGFLTDRRTAMAGALAAKAIARPESKTLGVIGTGIQARMQAELIARTLGLDEVLVWGRNADPAAALASNLGGESVSLETLCARSDLIVTATAAAAPLLTAEMVRTGTRIVAVGTDGPGKQELDENLVAKARLVVDSVDQCIDHGETGWAVRAGLVKREALIELGALLDEPRPFEESEIVIADLTGVAVQDVAIAKSVWRNLASAG